MASKRGLESSQPLGPGALQGNAKFATNVALLMLRLALGWTFVFHGSQKCFGAFGAEGMFEKLAEGLQQMGMPGFLPIRVWAYMAAYGELIGGVTVLLGLLARLGSIPIIVTMAVAIAKVHGSQGFSLEHMGYEYCLNLMAMAIVVLLAGPGLISVDALIFKRGLWARGPQPLDQPARRG